jgi:hypothetical protein
MRTHDDIWLPEQDQWGADRLAWEGDQEDSQDGEERATPPEDPRTRATDRHIVAR